MQPLVSVIIPTKNSARTIERCLTSIKGQTYKHIEIIVVDNFSEDSTIKIAEKYTENVYRKGPERTTQKNYGIEKSKGDYMLFIDGDMSLDSEALSDCVRIIGNSVGGGVVLPVVDVGSSFWTQVIAFERSFYKNTNMEAARFLRADLVRKVGGFKDIIFYEEFIVPQEIEKLGYTTKLHTGYNIYHDYDDFSFLGNLRKKFYYGKSLSVYKDQAKKMGFSSQSSGQINILKRYGVFLSNQRFYAQLGLGIPLLILKTCEFSSGVLGLLSSKLFK